MRGNIKSFAMFLLLFACAMETIAAEETQTSAKVEHCEQDPGWEAYQNKVAGQKNPLVRQSFGYRDSNIAGKSKGEIGGRIQRSSLPAYFVDRIAAKTLDDKLSASGTFAVKSIDGGGG